MKIPYNPFDVKDADIFSVEKIHQKYWKDFCDVCYPRFGFEEEGDGERTYEQKYDTFRHCHNFTKEMFDWDVKEMMKVHEHDFKRFRQAYELLVSLTTEDNACIPMVLVLLRMQQSIWNRLKEDGEMIEFIYPRKREVDYAEFKIGEVKTEEWDRHLIKDLGGLEKTILNGLYEERSWDEEWTQTISQAYIHHAKTYMYNDLEEDVEWDDDAGCISQMLARCILGSYNYSLEEFANKYNNVFTKGGGNVTKAITFRLFTTYQISLPEVKAIFEDYPEDLCSSKLTETMEELIGEFRQSRLGRHWCECIALPKGLEKVGRYLFNHRDSITEEEEMRFFYLLDEICIITDILRGNAQKYWLNVEYENDSDTDKPQESLNRFAPKKNLQELLKGAWFGEVCTDGKYDARWTDAFVEALMQSEYGEGIARQWAVKGVRGKHTQIKGYVVGLLKDAGVLRGSYDAIARKMGITPEARTFSSYMGDGKRQPYSEWVLEYVQ